MKFIKKNYKKAKHYIKPHLEEVQRFRCDAVGHLCLQGVPDDGVRQCQPPEEVVAPEHLHVVRQQVSWRKSFFFRLEKFRNRFLSFVNLYQI